MNYDSKHNLEYQLVRFKSDRGQRVYLVPMVRIGLTFYYNYELKGGYNQKYIY